jgi:hypothetical protein
MKLNPYNILIAAYELQYGKGYTFLEIAAPTLRNKAKKYERLNKQKRNCQIN